MSESTPTPPPTSAVLMSISKHIAIRCSKINRAYIDCKAKDADPAKCLAEGDAVTGCVIDLWVGRSVGFKCFVILFEFDWLIDWLQNHICAGWRSLILHALPSSKHIANAWIITGKKKKKREQRSGSSEMSFIYIFRPYSQHFSFPIYCSNRVTKCRKEQAEFEEACPV